MLACFDFKINRGELNMENKKVSKKLYDGMKRIDVLKIKSLQITYCMILSNIIIITVLFFMKKSFIKEAAIAFSIIGGFLFIFFLFGLYRGVRVTNKKIENKRELKSESKNDWKKHLFDLDFSVFADDGISGIIIGIVACFMLAILMLIIISIFYPLIFELGVFMLTAINFAITRVLRKVFILRKKCRGNMRESLKYSFIYSIIYTMAIFLVYLAGEEILKIIKNIII